MRSYFSFRDHSASGSKAVSFNSNILAGDQKNATAAVFWKPTQEFKDSKIDSWL